MNLIELVQNFLQGILIWIEGLGLVGVLIYILIYNLATILLIPGSVLTLGGGAIYGVFWGSVYVLIAATLGATVAFLIGRYVTRDWVERKIAGNARFRAIEEAVAREGFKMVLLTRLSPIFPFNLLNYIFAVTRVSLKDYVMGSIGMVPGTILYVYVGSLVGDLTMLGTRPELSPQAAIGEWVVRLLGFAATVAVTIYITRIARNALAQSVITPEADDESPKKC